MTRDAAQPRLLTVASFCLLLVLAWLCYRPALGGTWQLDDVGNLGGLVRVVDAASALDFVLDGAAGPAGRPIALLSFALQADSYEQGPAAFLQFNIALHLLNTLVLGWVFYQLAIARGASTALAGRIAAAAAGAWVLMPLLATATLLVVQRMTTLSALFVFLGLGTYLLARRDIDRRPVRSLAYMSASLVIGTALAVLSKESGVLLPVLVLVLEATVLSRPGSLPMARWRLWQGVFLGMPLIAILVYLGSILPYPEALELRRGFSGFERLMTEARILWSYLSRALLGFPDRLGVFQAPPAVSHSLFEAGTLLACVSWSVLLLGSIAWRRRYPLAALAVLWYLAAHLVESTLVPLELYFEHRNYVALAGPLFAAGSALCGGPVLVRKFSYVVVPGFLLANAYFLYLFASLWGEPSHASRYWALHYPDSVRAVTNLATFQLDEEGPWRTLQTIDRFVLENPGHAYLRLQELNILCLVAPQADHAPVIAELERGLPAADFTYTAGGMLSQLFDTAAQGRCEDVDTATVARLAGLLRGNPRYAGDSGFNRFYQKLLAGIARQRGDLEATLEHLDAAMARGRTSELNMMMVTALAGAGRFDAARQFIEDAESRAPANPIRSLKWRRDLDGLRRYIQELENSEQ